MAAVALPRAVSKHAITIKGAIDYLSVWKQLLGITAVIDNPWSVCCNRSVQVTFVKFSV